MARSRSNSRQLTQLFEASTCPIYALDEHRNIIYCNRACLQWVGLEESAILGLRCDYHSQPQSTGQESLETAAGLSPVPEAFAGCRASGEVFCRRSTGGDMSQGRLSGHLSRRRCEFIPFNQDSQEGFAVMVVVESNDAEEPNDPSRIESEVESVELHRRLAELRHELGRRYNASRVVGQSDVMARVRKQVELAIVGDAPVLIFGPAGSGRRHIAHAIHHGADPQTADPMAPPLIPLSCPLCDAEMIQQAIRELSRPSDASGRSAGTLLLLEADCLSEGAQHELLGFLRLPNFRFNTIATAQCSLLEAAETGSFLKELALALSALVIQLPPLADRPEDVPLLAQCLLEDCNARGERQLSGFSPDALDQLAAYPWPGNIDELSEMVEDICERAEGALVTATDLPDRIRQAAYAASFTRREEESIVLDDFLGAIERELIGRALRRAKGNKTQAAQRLGISRAKLLRRLGHLGVDSQTDGVALD